MPSEIERISLSYKNCSQKFLQSKNDYTKQYCNIYVSRLQNMEKLLIDKIKAKWGDKYTICKLHKITEEMRTQNEKCVVIGTLFKDQKLKPSVLKQLAESNQIIPQPFLSHFTDESDVLFMEDEVQRYQIMGNIDGTKLVTGISCALLGTDIGKGKFDVEDLIFVSFRDQIKRPIFEEPLLFYWISGIVGNSDLASKVCRVIIAGNSIRNEPPPSKPTISMISRKTESQDTIEAVKSFDSFLLQLCQVVDVDLMPGAHDPTNHILPQKPMHFCMFPESSVYKSFNQAPNPYICEVGDLKIAGTSGQPVTDIMRFCDITDPLEAMENCLIWNHLAPTAPDTLGCYPYYDKDPFIIEECPHVFFAGNQEKFGTKMVKGENGQEELSFR
ncbi:hypothetical protein GWI33_008906 [Rhynchophorus ferrugineus]|uniref:DNA polymerase delta small subunit n=1 Tax=Rhynchophorus ferrugineus TaxID=354439 RepID=A0A834IVL9_RHYFE|nr:hypothetical protein GWI33_008906 [Rhynchophorus ferrugineus]